MGKLIFILGGVRAGKSGLALELAQKAGKKVTFIATAAPLDAEMKKRIKRHKNSRPKEWKTVEVESNLAQKIVGDKNKVILIDCLTIYVARLMNQSESKILEEIKNTLKIIKRSKAEFIVVSNEVGCAVHPENKLARAYGDVLGRVNQMFALAADEFYVLFAGIPVNIKKLRLLNNSTASP